MKQNLLKIGKNLIKNLDQEQKKIQIKKRDTFESVNAIYEGRESILNAVRSGIFPKRNKGKGLKILTPKQMLQRLMIAIAQVKAGKSYK